MKRSPLLVIFVTVFLDLVGFSIVILRRGDAV
jgi:hypothetical protein